MSITDELRAVAAKTECANGRCEKLYRGDLDRIADRIDAEHEKAIHELNGFAEVSVLLPKDANGEPVYVGDEMECITPLHPDVPKAFKVQRISLESSGWTLVAYPASYKPENCCHVKQPTVEDVLQEFADQYAFYKEIEKGVCPDLESHKEVLRQFAAKLRLADE